MSYVNKTHKVNFALDDYDFEIVEKLKNKFNCSVAEVFRKLLKQSNIDLYLALFKLREEVQGIRQDLIKLVRS